MLPPCPPPPAPDEELELPDDDEEADDEPLPLLEDDEAAAPLGFPDEAASLEEAFTPSASSPQPIRAKYAYIADPQKKTRCICSGYVSTWLLGNGNKRILKARAPWYVWRTEEHSRMAIKMLTPEQVRTMTLAEKDEWWLKNVYRGGEPQLTIRSALTGMVLGSILSLTNLYIAARTGWLLGVGITSVILAFGAWKLLARLGLGTEMTVLENNAMQSIATAAGYMTAPLISSLAAYTMITGRMVPMYVAFLWTLCLALLGILFAFPMKKRFINDEQYPFPEGMAAGVVMDSLHQNDAKEGMLKAKLLLGGGLLSCFIEVLRSDKLMRFMLGLKAIPAFYDELLYRIGLRPQIRGVLLSDLTIRMDTSIIFIATGALTGIGTGTSMLLGAIVNYVFVAPILIQHGIIPPNQNGQIGYEEIIVWALWGGVACMTTSSLFSFLSKPKAILGAFGAFKSKRGEGGRDVLAHIELPVRWSLVGIPILGLALALICYIWLDVPIIMSLIAVPLVFVFSLIGVHATALTAITPTSALAQLTQLVYGVIAPGSITTNIVTAGIASEVSGHASNLLMDIKPGYMLGAKPRQQAVGHMLGAIAGLVVAIPVWYLFIIAGDIKRLGTGELPLPAAVVWKAVGELLMKGLSFLHPTARAAVVVGAVVGILFELIRKLSKDRIPLSAIGFGLAFVLRFSDALAIFMGGLLFWLLERRAAVHLARSGKERADSEASPPVVRPKRSWVLIGHENKETICAGVIAGGSLTGITLTIVSLWIPDVQVFDSIGSVFHQLADALRGIH